MKMTMKISALACLLAAGLLRLSAETYYFDYGSFHTAGADMNLSETQSYWFADSSFSTPVENLDFLTSGGDDIVFVKPSSTTENNVTLVFDMDVRVASFHDASIAYSYFRMEPGKTFTVEGNARLGNWSSALYGASGGGGAISIQGDLTMNQNYSIGNIDFPLESLYVGGLTTLANVGEFIFCASGSGSHGIDEPDAVFAGGLTTHSSVTRPLSMQFGARIPVLAVNAQSCAWINGVNGYVGLSMGGNSNSSGVFNVVLTNLSDASSSGNLSMANSAGTGRMNIVMRSSQSNGNGAYTYFDRTQSFTGDDMGFKGNVALISGTLKLNYRASGADLAGRGNLILSRASGAGTAAFGNSSDTVGGTFAFSAIEVSDGGGSIIVRLDSADGSSLSYDCLSLENSVSGNGTVVIDLQNFNGNNPDELIDIMIKNDITLKVISWAEAAESGITFTAADDYKVYDYFGELYYFTVQNAADGLYISYQIPEPAEWAAIFGAVAAAVAIRRRR